MFILVVSLWAPGFALSHGLGEGLPGGYAIPGNPGMTHVRRDLLMHGGGRVLDVHGGPMSSYGGNATEILVTVSAIGLCHAVPVRIRLGLFPGHSKEIGVVFSFY